MEEFSIEEKAKRYDEVVAMAKECITYVPDEAVNKYMLNMFPELYESEDERIRKWIKKELESKYVVNNKVNYEMADRAFAWLEKQGEETSWKPSKDLYGIEDDVRRRSTIQVLEYARSLDTYNQYGKADIDKNIAWLEKQGQSKKTSIWKHWKDGIAGNGNDIPVFLIKNGLTYSLSPCLSFECDYIELSELDSLILEKQGEQKLVDKIEPKFKVGNWVVWKDKCYKVNYNGCGYELVDQNGLSTSLEYGTIDESAHLWDVTKDAKDGDVLACKNGWTCIFKCLNDNVFSSHCFMDSEGWFCENGGQAHMLDNSINIHPVTKVQRDTLEIAMLKAGYKWNKDKKELIKL